MYMHDHFVLSEADRSFFTDVSNAVFKNPFSTERHALDLRIADTEDSLGREELLTRVVERIRSRLHAVGSQRLDLTSFVEPTRALLERAVLFVVFHDFSAPLDALIRAQLEAKDEPVEFDGALTTTLRTHGLERDRAVQMTGVIFQMRRAFTFIDGGLVGRSPCMRRLREQLWNNVVTADIGRYATQLTSRMEDFSTILLGETGSGKGAAAAAIGRSSFIPYVPSKKRFASNFAAAFVPINLSQYPAALVESELFGHRKGAFTGAAERHDGVFNRCDRHGAVFLDEIGEVPIPIQIKLLRVLQEREFFAVGSHDPQRFSGRVIAATNRDLTRLRAEGAFRDDFYYRLCSDVIEVPTLRQRIAEDPTELDRLLEVQLARIVQEPSPPMAAELADGLRRSLPAAYGWPGNVRELEQALRRMLLGRAYEGDNDRPAPQPTAALVDGIMAGTLSARDLQRLYCRLLHERHGTYEAVARRTGLDRRTVKKHLTEPQD